MSMSNSLLDDLLTAPPSHKLPAILLFGPPGSGKGTQGTILGTIPNLIHISTGDMMRKLSRQGRLADEVLKYSSKGLLVPDELAVQIWRRHVKILELREFYIPTRQVLLLDGIPRTRFQAQLLADTLEVVLVLHLQLRDQNHAMKRLKVRALKENRLDDANDEVIRQRFDIYRQETEPVLQCYDKSLICNIDADRSPVEVLSDIVDRLRKLSVMTGGG